MSPENKNSETMSVFSPALAKRFDALVEKYPVKRSALIPMLLYAQDEVGYLSDAVVAEVALRIGITELEVRNVATYYSMPVSYTHLDVYKRQINRLFPSPTASITSIHSPTISVIVLPLKSFSTLKFLSARNGSVCCSPS